MKHLATLMLTALMVATPIGTAHAAEQQADQESQSLQSQKNQWCINAFERSLAHKVSGKRSAVR